MRITTTDKLPDLNIAGLNKILQIKPDVSDETHKEILEKLFEEKQPASYKELVAEMGDYYAAAGYKRGVNGVKNLLQILTNKNIITRSQNGYDFHPDYLNHVFHNDEDEV